MGKLTTVIGANVAGKSELVPALAGMLKISVGAITLNGQPLKPTRASVCRADIAAVPG
jgi:branched-chain amino acid transport system ATP-binding protein